MSYQFSGFSDFEPKTSNKTISQETIKNLMEHDSKNLIPLQSHFINDIQDNFGIPLPAFPHQIMNLVYDYNEDLDKNTRNTNEDVPSPSRYSPDELQSNLLNPDNLLNQQDKGYGHDPMFCNQNSQLMKSGNPLDASGPMYHPSINLTGSSKRIVESKQDFNDSNLINIAKSVSTSASFQQPSKNTLSLDATNMGLYQNHVGLSSLFPPSNINVNSTSNLLSTNYNLYSYNNNKINNNSQLPTSTSSASHSSEDSEDDSTRSTNKRTQRKTRSRSSNQSDETRAKSKKRKYADIVEQDSSKYDNLNKSRRSLSYSTYDKISTNDQDDDEDDDKYSLKDDNEDKSNLTPEELKRRRLARKAELARLSRKYKKNRLACLEDEVVRLRQELADARRLPSAQLRLDELQGMLQSILQTIVPALSTLSEQTHIPVPGISSLFNATQSMNNLASPSSHSSNSSWQLGYPPQNMNNLDSNNQSSNYSYNLTSYAKSQYSRPNVQ